MAGWRDFGIESRRLAAPWRDPPPASPGLYRCMRRLASHDTAPGSSTPHTGPRPAWWMVSVVAFRSNSDDIQRCLIGDHRDLRRDWLLDRRRIRREPASCQPGRLASADHRSRYVTFPPW